MRPEILFPLFEPVENLKGVGARTAKPLMQLTGPHVADVLWHLPVALIDRRHAPSIADARAGVVATMTVRVGAHEPGRTKRQPYRVPVSDDTGTMTLVFFHARPDYLRRQLPEGETRIVSGRLESYDGALQMPHPDHIAAPAQRHTIPAVEPVYPLTAGLSLRVLTKIVADALSRVPALPDWLDAHHKAATGWPDSRQALLLAHAPAGPPDLDPAAPARRRLAYDELLANQVALALVRRSLRKAKGRAVVGDGSLRAAVTDALPYELTGAQHAAVDEILADMAAGERMMRLLQGDVGSGKTVVALLALLAAVEAGGQGVLMAPTEILARQHHAELSKLAAAANVRVGLLTGREKGKARAALLDDLASGAVPICVGTHALIQDDVAFRDLMLAVVDEQHRFGVEQRLALTAKGRAVDVLVTTATPIPRTLMLTAYGDMEVSRLREKPPGRKPVDTRVLPLERLDDVTAAVRRAVDAGGKVYWVCPLVEDSDVLDATAAETRHAALARLFGARVGLVHGRMKAADKDAVMAAFIDGPLQVLVATTVIEVGVDVPDATVMVIEHAERFGLAQLHQLRGRVGRGDKPGVCLLLYQAPLGSVAKARLTTMRDTDDGFVIAEDDLRLRGAGEVLGTRQSGVPDFRLADLAHHEDLLQTARDDAALIMQTDPDLNGPRGAALRVLLYLFERDAAIRTLRSG
jgi:ATP-dependent DNA helicase RecG